MQGGSRLRAVAGLTGLGAFLGMLAPSWAAGPPIDGERPPRPIVRSHGERERAKPGSYCWPQSDGGFVCAEAPPPGLPIPTERSVPAHPGAQVIVDPRHATTELIVRTRSSGARPWVESHQLDPSGELWRFRIPPRVRRTKQVILDFHYDHGPSRPGGSAIFGIQLKLHFHS
jgi:hypothetical protein